MENLQPLLLKFRLEICDNQQLVYLGPHGAIEFLQNRHHTDAILKSRVANSVNYYPICLDCIQSHHCDMRDFPMMYF